MGIKKKELSISRYLDKHLKGVRMDFMKFSSGLQAHLEFLERVGRYVDQGDSVCAFYNIFKEVSVNSLNK